LRNGAATRSPAEIDVSWFETRVEGDDVQIFI